ncbi:hypothetical protein TeGR_g12204 [Tetraparma gracilis]|uniref:Protein kinase domain-containing protein n=1 Tax=Tetraparma gracilis TaxID=2962635 RepID=A0ABQ6MMA5_9STRA|nr:hypothetical protein TeGR_g12204 [Tetraparma gracilis]
MSFPFDLSSHLSTTRSSSVFRGVCRATLRPVAVKVLLPPDGLGIEDLVEALPLTPGSMERRAGTPGRAGAPGPEPGPFLHRELPRELFLDRAEPPPDLPPLLAELVTPSLPGYAECLSHCLAAETRNPSILPLHSLHLLHSPSERTSVLLLVTPLALGKVPSQEPLPPAEIDKALHSLSRALPALHGLGLLHLDLKPSNLLRVAGYPHYLLADFGAARPSCDLPPGPTGTLPFMHPSLLPPAPPPGPSPPPPSQISPEPDSLPDPLPPAHLDSWSLGCLLYTLVHGHHPQSAQVRASLPGCPPPAGAAGEKPPQLPIIWLANPSSRYKRLVECALHGDSSWLSQFGAPPRSVNPDSDSLPVPACADPCDMSPPDSWSEQDYGITPLPPCAHAVSPPRSSPPPLASEALSLRASFSMYESAKSRNLEFLSSLSTAFSLSPTVLPPALSAPPRPPTPDSKTVSDLSPTPKSLLLFRPSLGPLLATSLPPPLGTLLRSRTEYLYLPPSVPPSSGRARAFPRGARPLPTGSPTRAVLEAAFSGLPIKSAAKAAYKLGSHVRLPPAAGGGGELGRAARAAERLLAKDALGAVRVVAHGPAGGAGPGVVGWCYPRAGGAALCAARGFELEYDAGSTRFLVRDGGGERGLEIGVDAEYVRFVRVELSVASSHGHSPASPSNLIYSSDEDVASLPPCAAANEELRAGDVVGAAFVPLSPATPTLGMEEKVYETPHGVCRVSPGEPWKLSPFSGRALLFSPGSGTFEDGSGAQVGRPGGEALGIVSATNRMIAME